MEEGTYAQVRLDQLNFSWCAHSPGPLHLGNVTALYLMDARADAHQRRALEDMLTKNPDVMPFGVFTSLTSTFLGIRYVTFELDLKGIHSRARVPGILDYQLAPMKNPVTGEEEPATLLKPKAAGAKMRLGRKRFNLARWQVDIGSRVSTAQYQQGRRVYVSNPHGADRFGNNARFGKPFPCGFSWPWRRSRSGLCRHHRNPDRDTIIDRSGDEHEPHNRVGMVGQRAKALSVPADCHP